MAENFIREINGEKTAIYASELENSFYNCILNALMDNKVYDAQQKGYIDEFLRKYEKYKDMKTSDALEKGLVAEKLLADMEELAKNF